MSQLNGVPERLLDVGPWLELESQRVPGALRVRARNTSARRIDQARVEITCGGKSAEAVFDGVGPMATAIADLPPDAVGGCAKPGLRLTSALW